MAKKERPTKQGTCWITGQKGTVEEVWTFIGKRWVLVRKNKDKDKD